jgi:serine/threonine protein phosphatase PrpC
MGGELDKPILIKNPIDGKTKLFRYGINEVQGYKKTMEVFYFIDNDLGPDKNVNIFGLFEGHSGREIAKYLSLNFTSELLKNNNFINGNYKQALIETCKNIDASLRTNEVNDKLINFREENNDEKRTKIIDLYKTIDKNSNLISSEIEEINTLFDLINPNNLEEVFISDFVGASGIIILIIDKITYIAKAGNSHCIIIKKKNSVNTIDINFFKQNYYKNKENEKRRIKIAKELKTGKTVSENKEYLYTKGFGDFNYKNNHLLSIEEQEVSSEPDIYEIPNENLQFLIICNSGFFENEKDININYNNIEKNIANYFIPKLQNKKKIISDIIGDYFDECITIKNNNDNYNKNNLSCIIIDYMDN